MASVKQVNIVDIMITSHSFFYCREGKAEMAASFLVKELIISL